MLYMTRIIVIYLNGFIKLESKSHISINILLAQLTSSIPSNKLLNPLLYKVNVIRHN